MYKLRHCAAHLRGLPLDILRELLRHGEPDRDLDPRDRDLDRPLLRDRPHPPPPPPDRYGDGLRRGSGALAACTASAACSFAFMSSLASVPGACSSAARRRVPGLPLVEGADLGGESYVSFDAAWAEDGSLLGLCAGPSVGWPGPCKPGFSTRGQQNSV